MRREFTMRKRPSKNAMSTMKCDAYTRSQADVEKGCKLCQTSGFSRREFTTRKRPRESSDFGARCALIRVRISMEKAAYNLLLRFRFR